MADTAPGHIANMKNTVDAAEIDEGAVVGDVLDGAFKNDTFLEDL